MRRSSFRMVPVTALACLAAMATVAAPLAAAERPRPVPAAAVYPGCDLLVQGSRGTSVFPLPTNAGVFQPIDAVGNVAACSLNVEYKYAYARMDLVQWDPLTLAPDPTTVALRSRTFDATAIVQGRTRFDLYPPVITRIGRGVADPPKTTTAIDWYASSNLGSYYESNGSPAIPVALQYPAVGAPRTPLPGAHPVLAHAVCGGDAALQELQVIQSVMTTNQLSDISCYDIIQRFRVPVRTRLHWVELAFGVPPVPRYIDPTIAILDASGADEPPVALPPPLIEAAFRHWVARPFWGSHYDFDRFITLEPDHDYWLLARVEQLYVVYARTRTGNEDLEFTRNIGPYFRRTTADGAWIPERDLSLSFRLIGAPVERRELPRGRMGEPRPRNTGRTESPAPPSSVRPEAETSAAGTSDAPLAPRRLALHVAPNPSQGAAFVSWSGAHGPVRLDVLDAQGRRVGGVADLAESEGRWLWRGARDDGGPLPAGMYFVRATDLQGRAVSARVVLIR